MAKDIKIIKQGVEKIIDILGGEEKNKPNHIEKMWGVRNGDEYEDITDCVKTDEEYGGRILVSSDVQYQAMVATSDANPPSSGAFPANFVAMSGLEGFVAFNNCEFKGFVGVLVL